MLKHFVNVAHSLLREHVVKRVTRSSEWHSVEKAHLKVQPFCAACGSNNRLQVHHKEPFHLDPALELDPTNLITLCMDTNECHLKLGHGDNFKAYNPNIVADVEALVKDPSVRSLLEARAKENRKFI
jgi:5-methylcytosine-specific restriction endonuclease McrA